MTDGGLTVNKDIEQNVIVLDNNYEKLDALKQLLTNACLKDDKHDQQKIIIFCMKKIGVDQLEHNLRQDYKLAQRIRFEVSGIHGDKQQRDRDDILRRFKTPLDQFFST